jgi:hypothetical protein
LSVFMDKIMALTAAGKNPRRRYTGGCPGQTGCRIKNSGLKDPALVYPWKGLFHLEPYKLKVSKVI